MQSMHSRRSIVGCHDRYEKPLCLCDCAIDGLGDIYVLFSQDVRVFEVVYLTQFVLVMHSLSATRPLSSCVAVLVCLTRPGHSQWIVVVELVYKVPSLTPKREVRGR